MNLRAAVVLGSLMATLSGCASSYEYIVDGKQYRCAEGGTRRKSDIVANCIEVRQPGWYRSGATAQDFNRDKYECTREAAMVPRVPYPSAPPPVSGSGLAAGLERGYNSGIYDQGIAAARASEVRAAELFDMCLNARGWEYRTE